MRTKPLVWLAAACFLVSFVLPAARLGPPGDRPAPGFMAAILAAYVLPMAIQGLAAGQKGASDPYALAAGIYFTLAWMANLAMVYVLLAAAWGDERKQRRATRVCVVAALLVWGALLVDYRRLYTALGLAQGEAVELYAGYYLWALSFALGAAALIQRDRAR